MSEWVKLERDEDKRSANYFGLILGLSLGFACILYIAGSRLALTVSIGSVSLHNDLLGCILKQPVAFFDTNPVGRILNRFSKGMSEVCL